jgi:PAS domain S-box-containing protein
MTWLFPSVIATLTGVIVLTLAYAYLFFKDRDPSVGIWTASWSFYALRLVCMLLILVWGEQTLFLIGNQLFSLMSGLLLLWGTYEWSKRRMPKIWIWASILCTVWIALAITQHFSFWLLALPTFTFIGLTYIWSGFILIRYGYTNELGELIVAWTFILWGVHKMDYPFLRPLLWIAPWGYLLGAFFSLISAIGIILVYLEGARDALQKSEERLHRIVENMPVMMDALDEDANFIAWNRECEQVTGYSAEEIIGNPRAIQILYPDADYREQMLAEVSNLGFNFRDEEYTLISKDGAEKTISWSNISAQFPIPDWDTWAIGVDVTERKQTEEKLKQALAERTALLQELYHRTKNNMQVICALLDFQAARLEDQAAQEALAETQHRIQSMALVHKKLYQSQDLSRINLREYIQDLTALLTQSYQLPSNKVALVYNMEDVFVLIDTAVPCGLILNELISNALKYAFPGDRQGEITIQLRRIEDEVITLQVADNGVGVPNDFDFRRDSQLGLKNILALGERQLQGQVHFERRDGVTCRLRFNDNLYTERV